VEYAIDHKPLDEVSFYVPALRRDKLLLTLNQEHSFFTKIYEPLFADNQGIPNSLLGYLQLLLLSVARAECNIRSRQDRDAVKRLREEWSNALTAFLD
jgi:hypothetical protein